MGKSLALNMAKKGVRLSVYNRHVKGKEVDIAKTFVNKNNTLGIQGFDDIKTFVNSLEKPRNILMMVNAGKPVDAVIKEILPLLGKNDIIIDGGNSHFLDTQRREEEINKEGILFLGVGISGGEEGALKGPSMMPGGSKEGYERVASILESIAAKDKKENPCCEFIGSGGSGHFVKTIHNGIEYAEMQIIAEVYHLLRFYGGKDPVKISNIFENWLQNGLESYLLQITINILRKKEENRFLIDIILDVASQKGTGGWSTIESLQLGKPLDTVSEAVMVRFLSAMKPLREKASLKYNVPKEHIHISIQKLKNAYAATRIVNHAIGFDLIQEASEQYNWNLNLSKIARIWTNGCIIRSELMENISELYKDKTEHLLLHKNIVQELNAIHKDYAEIVAKSILSFCPMPVFSSALNYFSGFISEQSSANIIQAQRDYFGAHTYQRKDASTKEYFHTNWQ